MYWILYVHASITNKFWVKALSTCSHRRKRVAQCFKYVTFCDNVIPFLKLTRLSNSDCWTPYIFIKDKLSALNPSYFISCSVCTMKWGNIDTFSFLSLISVSSMFSFWLVRATHPSNETTANASCSTSFSNVLLVSYMNYIIFLKLCRHFVFRTPFSLSFHRPIHVWSLKEIVDVDRDFRILNRD